MPALVEQTGGGEGWTHLEIQLLRGENHSPPLTSALAVLRHRDKGHTHFTGGKSEVREVDTLGHDLLSRQ